MISVTDLVFKYTNSPFELRIEKLAATQAECVAVVGPSGSGKTTLLNLLAGILLPQTGTITVGETVVSSLTDAARRDFRIANIGFVFQDFELVDYLNVRENILLPCFINGSLPATAERKSRADALAASMGMTDKLTRPIQRLSQGERQRVAICRALLTEPKVLLADEPTGNLDPSNKTNIVNLLTNYAKESEASLVVVTHDHSLLPLFDRVIDFTELLTPVAAS